MGFIAHFGLVFLFFSPDLESFFDLNGRYFSPVLVTFNREYGDFLRLMRVITTFGVNVCLDQ